MSALAKVVAALRPGSGRRRVGPIGIDFGLEAVHMVQLESLDGAKPVLRARASLDYHCSRQELLGDPARFRSVIKKALAADRFSGRNAVIAVPVSLFRTLSINYTSHAGKDDADAVLRVMRDRLDGDLSDFVLDFLPVRSRSKNNERLALVAVSENKPIVDFLEAARKAGLSVEALEIGPLAISRLVGSLAVDDDEHNVLVINSGRQASYLTLISGTDLLFDQQINFGETTLVQQLAAALDMPEQMARGLMEGSGVKSSQGSVDDAIDQSSLSETVAEIVKPQFIKLVDEIKRVCLYAAAETRGGGVSRVYLLGSLARWPGADVLLGSLADVDVAKIPDPLVNFKTRQDQADPARNILSPEIAVATGLALRRNDHYG